MTYQQSLALIEKLKNIVWPYTDEWFVFFDFKNETEFEVKFFGDTSEAIQAMNGFLAAKTKAYLPYSYVKIGNMQHNPEICMFYYCDANIDYFFNLMTNAHEVHDSRERLRQCAVNIGLEMIRLTRKLENMKKNKIS